MCKFPSLLRGHGQSPQGGLGEEAGAQWGVAALESLSLPASPRSLLPHLLRPPGQHLLRVCISSLLPGRPGPGAVSPKLGPPESTGAAGAATPPPGPLRATERGGFSRDSSDEEGPRLWLAAARREGPAQEGILRQQLEDKLGTLVSSGSESGPELR